MADQKQQNVWLSVVGTAQAFGQTDKTEFMTEGTAYWNGDAPCLSYKETEISGMPGTMTTIKVEADDKVSVMRIGEINSLMTFEIGKPNLAVYSTPMGDIPMTITTDHIDLHFTPDDAMLKNIALDYHIEMQGQDASHNTLIVDVSARE